MTFSRLPLAVALVHALAPQQKLERLSAPVEGSKPLSFTSVYAASSAVQTKACMERTTIQVCKLNGSAWLVKR